MSYFEDHYDDFRWTLSRKGNPGLRLSQLGALHAIGAHFSTKRTPATISMPTGSGKTAVLMGAAFLLRARRVLVITPSRVVREQIEEEFTLLKTLKKLGCLQESIPSPKVYMVTGVLQTTHEWEALSAFDVVVSTPNAASPGLRGQPGPPSELFDLILIDEAHHGPAPTWQALLDRTENAVQIHFTATPFREDGLQVGGRLIFNYRMRDAFRDGVFGKLTYRAVKPQTGEDDDVAIAEAATKQLKEDRAVGMDHRILVRTGTIVRANELLKLYRDKIGIKVRLITGDKTLRHVRRTIDEVRSGELDGIVCVDMLGEGFDLPSLKIAALHTPHKSLAVTLQFVGRFSRTTSRNLGSATFFALESDMAIEREQLFREGAVWEEIIPELSGRRIDQEELVREDLATFSSSDELPSEEEDEDADLSLYALRPFRHVKIFAVNKAIDVLRPIKFPRGMELVLPPWYSKPLQCAVFIVRRFVQPEWVDSQDYAYTEHHLIVVHFHRLSGLIFVNSSLRIENLYASIALQVVEGITGADVRELSIQRLNKVLLDLKKVRFFNVGMRNSDAGNVNEAYRTITGSRADEAIDPVTGKTHARGHFYGTALSGTKQVTIGLSGASKLWSNTSSQIPDLIRWCDAIAEKLRSDRTPHTDSNIEYLPVGEELDRIPENVMWADWSPDAYDSPRLVRWYVGDQEPRESELLDLDLRINHRKSSSDLIALDISDERNSYGVTFSLLTDKFFHASPENDVELADDQGQSLAEYLNFYPPTFYTSNYSSFTKSTFYPRPNELDDLFDLKHFEAVDWAGEGIDRKLEVGPDPSKTIHGYVEARLTKSDAHIVFYDHGSGEIADYVAVFDTGEFLKVSFYHCKGSGGDAPGNRVNDAYEVCGQVAKAFRWRYDLADAVARRVERKSQQSRFVKGNLELLITMLEPKRRQMCLYEAVIVQPGFDRSNLEPKIASLLAATNSILRDFNFLPLKVFGSASGDDQSRRQSQ